MGDWLSNIPVVGRLYHDFLVRKNFSEELKMINRRPLSFANRPSIIHFANHKTATQHLKSIYKELAKANDLHYLNFGGLAFETDFPFLGKLTESQLSDYHYLFERKGCIYQFGRPIVGIPHFDQYKKVLMVRDPRDILVSAYYSMKISHAVPNKNSDKQEAFLEKRRIFEEEEVDASVLRNAAALGEKLEGSINFFTKNDNFYLTKYEEMIGDYPRWLQNLCDYCELDLRPEIKQRLLSRFQQSKPKSENAKRHLRKGIAGDYKNKLQEKTIAELNEVLKKVLETWDYVDNPK